MQKCVEARYWPDSLSDVPDDRLEEFLIHAERCPYHEELIRMEESPFMATARLARSLTSDCHLPSTHEDRAEIEENYRNYNRWIRSGESVQSLSLRYRGEEVARHERFLGLDTRVTRELDVPGDLQVWKLADDTSDEDIFLGVYLVQGFSHEGKPEYLELANGQKVKLKVKHVLDNKYEIEFACAEPNDVMETLEESEAPLTKSATGAGGHSALAAWNSSVTEQLRDAPWQLLTSRPGVMTITAMAVILVFSAGFVIRGKFSAGYHKAQPSNIGTVVEKTVTESQNPPETRADLSQRTEPPGTDEAKESVTVTFTPGPPLRRTGAVRREQNHTSFSKKKVETTSKIDSNSLDKEPASGTPLSTSTWYLTNGPKPQAVWIRTGDDIGLRDEVLIALHRSYGQEEGSSDLGGPHKYRVVRFNFNWKNQVGVVEAQVSDEESKPLMTFVCQSKAAVLEQAREQAIRGIILDLVSYLQSTSDADGQSSTGNSNLESGVQPRITTVNPDYANKGIEYLAGGF